MSIAYGIRISLRSLPHHPRAFCTTPRILTPSFLDLQARSVSRENGHFSRLSGVNYIEHSPALQLLRSECNLAEGKEEASSDIRPTLVNKDKGDILLDEYKRQIEGLRAQVAAKEQAWNERYQSERKEWEEVEEKSLRLRLLLGISLVFAGLLVADSFALAEEVEQHCPGCFEGNSKKQLFVVGYLKQVTDGFARWWDGESSAKRNASPSALGPTAAAQNSKSDVLPVWEEKRAPDGRLYSANHSGKHNTGHESRPTQSTSCGSAKQGLPAGWGEKATPDARPYLVNHSERTAATWSNPRKNRDVGTQTTIESSSSGDASFWRRLMWSTPRAT